MSDRPQPASWMVSYEVPPSFADNWSSTKVLSWTLLDVPGARIAPVPDTRYDYPDHYSWWLAAIDLLMYGKGWDDLAYELRRWRTNGYIAHDPVLSFVKNTWGETLIALEWYLLLHPQVNDQIFQSVKNARGHQFEYADPNPQIDVVLLVDLVNGLRDLRGDHPGTDFVDKLIGNEFNDEILEKLTDNPDEYAWGDSDPAHISGHFCQFYTEWSRVIEPSDSITFAGDAVILEVEKYEGWYHKIHNLRRESIDPENGLTDTEITEITVFVKNLGCLGTFVFDEGLNCFIRSSPDRPHEMLFNTPRLLSTSPRYGFPLNTHMASVLSPLMENFDPEEAEPIEELAIHTIGSIHLGAWLEYEITISARLNEYEAQEWTRTEGDWHLGLMFDESRLQACLIAMAKAGSLDLGEPPLDQIIDDTDVYVIQPWAVPFVLRLWDGLVEFPSALAEIAKYDADQHYTLAELEESHGDGLRLLIGERYDSIKSSDELASMENLPSLLRGESLSGYDILAALENCLF